MPLNGLVNYTPIMAIFEKSSEISALSSTLDTLTTAAISIAVSSVSKN